MGYKKKKGNEEEETAATRCRGGRVVASKQTEGAKVVYLLLPLSSGASFKLPTEPKLSPTQTATQTSAAPIMAKTRVSLQRQAEHFDVHEDDQREEEANSELGESMDPLDESRHTVDSSDEEVEDAVAEDMARFEETFAGITKRFRLINRIGEGKSTTDIDRVT